MKCPYCGKDVVEGSKFCDGCGAKLGEQTSKTEETVYYQPKKNKTGLIVTIVIISILLIAGIIVAIVLLTGGSKSDNSKTADNKIADKKTDLMSNIKYTDVKLKNGDIVVFVENNNNTEVSFSLEIEYYNEEGTKVDSSSQSAIGLLAKGKTVLKFYHSDREYKEYELHAEKLNGTFFDAHSKDVTMTSKDDKENEEIVVTVKNESSSKLDEVKVAAVFYKNDKVVGYSYDSEYDVDANEAIALYIDYPYDENYDTVEFDKYETYIVEAYSYKY